VAGSEVGRPRLLEHETDDVPPGGYRLLGVDARLVDAVVAVDEARAAGVEQQTVAAESSAVGEDHAACAAPAQPPPRRGSRS